MGGVRWDDGRERRFERDPEALAAAFFRLTVSAVLKRAVLRDEFRQDRQAVERLLAQQPNWDTYFQGERG